MKLTVASWSLGKDGQSSLDIKQEKVGGFIEYCCNFPGVDVVFLSEVHSAMVYGYKLYVQAVYGKNYTVYSQTESSLSAYVVLVRNNAGVEVCHDIQKAMGQTMVLLKAEDFLIGFPHAQSGQASPQQSQMENAARLLQQLGGGQGKWAMTGGMNWEYKDAHLLAIPEGAKCLTCWNGQTRRQGGILDWCIAGGAVAVTPGRVDMMFPPYVNNMKNPDCRPVVFSFQYD